MGQLMPHLMKFPPYTFQEYPKSLTICDRTAVVVDAEHEAAIRKMWAAKDAPEKRKPGRPRKA